MKSFPSIRTALSCALLALASANSLAANGFSANASIDDVHYTITLHDGSSQVPEFIYASENFSYTHLHIAPADYLDDSSNSDRGNDAVHLASQFQQSSSSASKPGNTMSLNATAQLQAGLNNFGAPSNALSGFETTSYLMLPGHATFTMTGVFSVMQDNSSGLSNAMYQSAAWARVELSQRFGGMSKALVSTLRDESLHANEEQDIALSIKNYDDTDTQVMFRLDTGAYVVALPYGSAVPEPASYGMLAGGLLLLGAVARRKAKQA